MKIKLIDLKILYILYIHDQHEVKLNEKKIWKNKHTHTLRIFCVFLKEAILCDLIKYWFFGFWYLLLLVFYFNRWLKMCIYQRIFNVGCVHQCFILWIELYWLSYGTELEIPIAIFVLYSFWLKVNMMNKKKIENKNEQNM